METGRVCTEDEAVHGCLEEEDPDPRDQEEAHLKDQEKSGLELLVLHQDNQQKNQETDREEVPEVQENHQEGQETGKETRFTPARGS